MEKELTAAEYGTCSQRCSDFIAHGTTITGFSPVCEKKPAGAVSAET